MAAPEGLGEGELIRRGSAQRSELLRPHAVMSAWGRIGLPFSHLFVKEWRSAGHKVMRLLTMFRTLPSKLKGKRQANAFFIGR